MMGKLYEVDGEGTCFTCIALAKAGLVKGPIRPSIQNTFGVFSLCHL